MDSTPSRQIRTPTRRQVPPPSLEPTHSRRALPRGNKGIETDNREKDNWRRRYKIKKQRARDYKRFLPLLSLSLTLELLIGIEGMELILGLF
ncbi:hypothetical protein MJO28_009180 [Puccinia striiformis f. sp. tritici]|uniref:Uncharacterized protein n=1 Tax=Puccinia striiformis f. sp. tritici TaxID=168172 RepID=A0ACC0E7T1_9BASI|nr:hypothetical protein MJO28_009180 [Puccinia striiformis f. sp. tritici]